MPSVSGGHVEGRKVDSAIKVKPDMERIPAKVVRDLRSSGLETFMRSEAFEALADQFHK